MDCYVSPEWSYAGRHHYAVWVDGVRYDEFTSKGWLTGSQMHDVAAGYAEALDTYTRPV